MVTITNRPREHFQSAIKSKLGWVGKRELRDMDVLLLRVINPGGSKLTVSPKNRPRNSDPDKLMDLPNQPIATLASMMEGYFEKPVIDQTGLTNSYDITLEGKWQADLQANLDFINKALPDQLGLELVPSREAIEMLVVEKAK